jgi:hypothetical protein
MKKLQVIFILAIIANIIQFASCGEKHHIKASTVTRKTIGWYRTANNDSVYASAGIITVIVDTLVVTNENSNPKWEKVPYYFLETKTPQLTKLPNGKDTTMYKFTYLPLAKEDVDTCRLKPRK